MPPFAIFLIPRRVLVEAVPDVSSPSRQSLQWRGRQTETHTPTHIQTGAYYVEVTSMMVNQQTICVYTDHPPACATFLIQTRSGMAGSTSSEWAHSLYCMCWLSRVFTVKGCCCAIASSSYFSKNAIYKLWDVFAIIFIPRNLLPGLCSLGALTLKGFFPADIVTECSSDMFICNVAVSDGVSLSSPFPCHLLAVFL